MTSIGLFWNEYFWKTCTFPHKIFDEDYKYSPKEFGVLSLTSEQIHLNSDNI